MRVSINLATQPYENVRRFYVWAVIGLTALLLVTAGLLYMAAVSWRNATQVSRLINQEKDVLEKLQEQTRRDEAILNRPENRDVREQGQFINDLIRRKAISWTKIFSDLEKMIPPRLQVVQISPEITKEGGIQLRMQVAADSRDRAFELVRRMEDSTTFRYPQVVAESATQQGEGGGETLQFDITAQYVPEMPSSAETTAQASRSGQ